MANEEARVALPEAGGGLDLDKLELLHSEGRSQFFHIEGDENAVTYVWELALQGSKLIAAARELERIRSALDMLERNSGRERGFWLLENIIKAAESLGWQPAKDATK